MGSNQYVKCIFSGTISPIELQFHMETPFGTVESGPGHMAETLVW